MTATMTFPSGLAFSSMTRGAVPTGAGGVGAGSGAPSASESVRAVNMRWLLGTSLRRGEDGVTIPTTYPRVGIGLSFFLMRDFLPQHAEDREQVDARDGPCDEPHHPRQRPRDPE